MSNVEEKVTFPRVDRVLTYAFLILVVISILSFVAIITGTALGMTAADFGAGAWPIVSAAVWLAAPLGFVCLFVVLGRSFVRNSPKKDRARSAKRG